MCEWTVIHRIENLLTERLQTIFFIREMKKKRKTLFSFILWKLELLVKFSYDYLKWHAVCICVNDTWNRKLFALTSEFLEFLNNRTTWLVTNPTYCHTHTRSHTNNFGSTNNQIKYASFRKRVGFNSELVFTHKIF